jgi:putative flippase GtrA
MTAMGWLIMFISVGTVTTLLVWCIYKVLTTPEETEHIHGFEQETPDAETRD